MELLRYIPQTYLEKVCTETEPGEASEFQRELRKVIYSHITDAERLGKTSLDELIEYKTEELNEQLLAHRREISRLNAEIVRLEVKGSADNVAQLQGKLKAKEQELVAHNASEPAEVNEPANLTEEQQQAYATIAEELEKERAALNSLEAKIVESEGRQRTLSEHIAIAKKLEHRLSNFETEFKRVKQECSGELEKLDLSFDEIITLTIKRSPLKTKHGAMVSEKSTIDEALVAGTDASLIDRKTACEGRIKNLQDKLDAPNKRYQTYKAALKAWQSRGKAIEGDSETAETRKYYEAQLRYITEDLSKDVARLEEKRQEHCENVYETIAAVRNVYEELFTPVQELIEKSVIIKEGFKLSFESSIIERTFQRDFFGTYINQGVAGSFCGKEKGATVLEDLRACYNFNDSNDAMKFVEDVITHLRSDMRTFQQGKMEITSQLRKHKELKDLYDYLWSFEYLEPEYSLRLDGKDLSHLSPGERGTLLLVFYLLVDRSHSPIIVDQPEENLDSQTVYRLLIPVIKEVKRRRQIIMVTHSPNIAVVCDAEQVIHSFIDRANGNRVVYTTGSIESPQINKYLIDVLEGTRPAFDNRESKYYSS